MKIAELKAEPRTGSGSAAARRLRLSGKVPAILYGHDEAVVGLSLDVAELARVLETGRHVVNLNIAGRQERALLKEVQHDTWGREILHVDFNRVGLDEKVTVEVSIVAHGTPKAIAGGAVLEQPLHTVEVECLADDIPDEIRVEVAEMDLEDKVHVRELPLPAGVKVLNDPEAIVFVVKAARVEEVTAPVAAEAAATEPEVIGRAAKEEAEGEEEEEKPKEKGKA